MATFGAEHQKELVLLRVLLEDLSREQQDMRKLADQMGQTLKDLSFLTSEMRHEIVDLRGDVSEIQPVTVMFQTYKLMALGGLGVISFLLAAGGMMYTIWQWVLSSAAG